MSATLQFVTFLSFAIMMAPYGEAGGQVNELESCDLVDCSC